MINLLGNSGYRRAGQGGVLGVVSRYAPAADNNNPAAYAARVARELGIAPNTPLDMSDRAFRTRLATAMERVETGGSTVVNRIDRSRPILENSDGSFSTEETVTFDSGGRFYNVPTIVNGTRRSEAEAIRLWENGQNHEVGNFGSLNAAVSAARQRSNRIGRARQRDRARQ